MILKKNRKKKKVKTVVSFVALLKVFYKDDYLRTLPLNPLLVKTN